VVVDAEILVLVPEIEIESVIVLLLKSDREAEGGAVVVDAEKFDLLALELK
jgi:hypothetical protein